MVEIKKIRASHVFRASALIVIQRFHEHIRFGNTLTFVIHSTYFMYGRLTCDFTVLTIDMNDDFQLYQSSGSAVKAGRGSCVW